jgi:hypothetical protein
MSWEAKAAKLPIIPSKDVVFQYQTRTNPYEVHIFKYRTVVGVYIATAMKYAFLVLFVDEY